VESEENYSEVASEKEKDEVPAQKAVVVPALDEKT